MVKAVELVTRSFLEIKDGVVANVNVAMFVHDVLVKLTSGSVDVDVVGNMQQEGILNKYFFWVISHLIFFKNL
jgi:hypothetical protein